MRWFFRCLCVTPLSFDPVFVDPGVLAVLRSFSWGHRFAIEEVPHRLAAVQGR